MKYTILINRQNEWKEKYQKNVEWQTTTNIDKQSILIEKSTFVAYTKLKKELERKNIYLEITAAYRSIKEQSQDCSNENISEYSEHHTGLALDIAIRNNGKYYKEITDENQKTWQEIYDVLAEYGFILRYPKGKEKITGHSYEPWHIRYVGKIPAAIIRENNLTLEEYLKDFGTVIYINKPKGITSHDVVEEISHLFGIKKVGHTGTLDPLAEGVLLVAVGKATKIVELLTAQDKEYIAGVELGYQTDTYDNTGIITATKEIPKGINLKETIKSFQKTYLQEVPIYSAVKVEGKKLYEYARKREEVTLPKKEVTIKEIDLLEETKNTFKFRALVTKGCYIRSLINDIGKSINTYATMTFLTRTKQGSVSLEDINTLEEIREGNITLHRIEDILNYPKITVEDELEFRIKNGQRVSHICNIQDKVIFLRKNHTLLGIYQKEDNQLKVWKNF